MAAQAMGFGAQRNFALAVSGLRRSAKPIKRHGVDIRSQISDCAGNDKLTLMRLRAAEKSRGPFSFAGPNFAAISIAYGLSAGHSAACNPDQDGEQSLGEMRCPT